MLLLSNRTIHSISYAAIESFRSLYILQSIQLAASKLVDKSQHEASLGLFLEKAAYILE